MVDFPYDWPEFLGYRSSCFLWWGGVLSFLFSKLLAWGCAQYDFASEYFVGVLFACVFFDHRVS